MNVILIHKDESCESHGEQGGLLRFAVGTEPLSACIGSRFRRSVFTPDGDIQVLVPQGWSTKDSVAGLKVAHYDPQQPSIPVNGLRKTNTWFAVYHGRFLTRIRNSRLWRILDKIKADVAAVNVMPHLQAMREKALIGPDNHLVGYRRFYDDSVRFCLIPRHWPHCLFIRTGILDKAMPGGQLPLDFTQFIHHCDSASLTVRSLETGGEILDLHTEAGLIGLLRSELTLSNAVALFRDKTEHIAETVKIFGNVTVGRDVHIGPDAIIVGPAILGDHSRIGEGTVVQSSIIAPGVSLPPGVMIQNRILCDSREYSSPSAQEKDITNTAASYVRPWNGESDHFRKWPVFSYAGFFKRIVDILVAAVVLLLFTPVMLVLMIMIKVFSPGPIFFAHRRQGLHGKEFNCIKFRTMIVGADEMQDKFRRLNQVDGPQFRIEDDPRISAVGKFLRDTYLDEIPQFFNVLLGQMSVVGPRPSPEAENTLCPVWRDARLSVRPGVTGLWQICRTRQPMQDFQEWIYYDIKYVKGLSLGMDLWICWLTAKKMFENFIHQF